jgi:hypothetical protein
MELVLIVIAFAAFAVINDAIESNKKKGKNVPPLPTRSAPKNRRIDVDFGGMEKEPDIIIPPIKGAPQLETEGVYSEPEVIIKSSSPVSTEKNKYAYYLEHRHEQKAKDHAQYEQETKVPATVKHHQQSTDIHTNVILSAMAYAQILERPKAYQMVPNPFFNQMKNK